MKKFLLVLLIATLGTGCATHTAPALEPALAGPVYLDVRTDEEVAEGKLADAVHIPIAELEGRLNELRAYDDREIVVYCRTGNRSARATTLLVENGFDNITDGGAMTAVVEAGAELQLP